MNTFSTYILLIFSLSLSLTSCSDDDENCSDNPGAIVTKVIELPPIIGIDLQLGSTVNLKQGPIQLIEIIGGGNHIDILKKTIDNGLWEISNDGNCSNQNLTLNITLPKIEKIYISGSGNINTQDFINTKNLILKISGSGHINLNKVDSLKNLTAKISGSGSMNLSDSLSIENNIKISISGSGDFYGFKATTDYCEISSSGSGSTQITIKKTLKASMSGSGNTYYKGSPQITSSVSGSGHIIDSN